MTPTPELEPDRRLDTLARWMMHLMPKESPGEHLADERVVALATGTLTDAERQEVLGHLAHCAECRHLMGLLVAEAADLGPTVVRLRPKRGRLFLRSALAIAAGLLLVVTVWTLWRLVPEPDLTPYARFGPTGSSTLSDGTFLFASANARWKELQPRKLELVSGEFWVHVAKDDGPFQFVTPKAQASTFTGAFAFDVQSREAGEFEPGGDPLMAVTVLSGSLLLDEQAVSIQGTPGDVLVWESARVVKAGVSFDLPAVLVGEGRLGLRLSPPGAGVTRSAGLARSSGLLVQEVTAGSPADRAGFRNEDVLLELAGQQISNDIRELDRLIADVPAGRPVKALVLRDLRIRKQLEVVLPDPEKPVGARLLLDMHFVPQDFGVVTTVVRVGDRFTIHSPCGQARISVAGSIEGDKVQVASICIEDKDAKTAFKTVDEVPEIYRETVRNMIGIAAPGEPAKQP